MLSFILPRSLFVLCVKPKVNNDKNLPKSQLKAQHFSKFLENTSLRHVKKQQKCFTWPQTRKQTPVWHFKVLDPFGRPTILRLRYTFHLFSKIFPTDKLLLSLKYKDFSQHRMPNCRFLDASLLYTFYTTHSSGPYD